MQNISFTHQAFFVVDITNNKTVFYKDLGGCPWMMRLSSSKKGLPVPVGGRSLTASTGGLAALTKFSLQSSRTLPAVGNSLAFILAGYISHILQ